MNVRLANVIKRAVAEDILNSVRESVLGNNEMPETLPAGSAKPTAPPTMFTDGHRSNSPVDSPDTIDQNPFTMSLEEFNKKIDWKAGESEKDKELDFDEYFNSITIETELSERNQKFYDLEVKLNNLIEHPDDPVEDIPAKLYLPDVFGLKPHPLPMDDEESDYDEIMAHLEDCQKKIEVKKLPFSPELEESIERKTPVEMGVTENEYITYPETPGVAVMFDNLESSGNSASAKQRKCCLKMVNFLRETLGMTLVRHSNKSWDDVKRILTEEGNGKDASGNCFMVVFMAYGFKTKNGREYLRFQGQQVDPVNIFPLVDGTNCPNWADKPKIILYLAWPPIDKSGLKSDPGDISSLGKTDRTKPGPTTVSNVCNFFIVSAIAQDENEGVFVYIFEDKFIETVSKHKGDRSWNLHDIMEVVNAKTLREAKALNMAVCANFTSSLTKSFYFVSKEKFLDCVKTI